MKRSEIMKYLRRIIFSTSFSRRSCKKKLISIDVFPRRSSAIDPKKRLKKNISRVIKIETVDEEGAAGNRISFPLPSFFSHRYRTLNCRLEELLWTVAGSGVVARLLGARRREHPFHTIRHVPVYYDSISRKWRYSLANPRNERARFVSIAFNRMEERKFVGRVEEGCITKSCGGGCWEEEILERILSIRKLRMDWILESCFHYGKWKPLLFPFNENIPLLYGTLSRMHDSIILTLIHF